MNRLNSTKFALLRMQSQAWSSDKRLIKSFKRTNTCAGTNNNMLGGLHSSTKTGKKINIIF